MAIDETNERITVLRGSIESKIKYKNEFTSGLTNKIILAIFNTNTCDLPTLKQSSHLHYELFRIFNAHIEKLTGVKPALCPIT